MRNARGGIWLSWGKRLGDVVVVAALAPLWLPLVLLVALLVRVTSGAPVLFKQKRVGMRGEIFTILKFRTMSPDALPAPGGAFSSWTYPSDPRVTKFGRWLRRWRLDELPQLLNVLVGDMSLVGPRPETPEVVEALSNDLPEYRRRLTVPPGLTGLCQLSNAYLRFATLEDLRRKLDFDIQYVERASLWTDAVILARTLVVLGRGLGVR
jgi:lipopolysaccharide/colanic/teichoic acid biosynthesis glycosyltransferase